ncbi:MAG: enoyl-CoA hydratase/isomerase family protein [Acidimicrobiales bacterium]
MAEVPVRGLPEAIGELTNPFALEELTDDRLPLFVVDMTGAPATDPQAVAESVATLQLVGAVTVGIVDALVSAPIAELAEHFDIVLGQGELAPTSAVATSDSSADVRTIAEAVSHNPSASVMLCHVLRQGPVDDVAHGLVTESLSYGALQASAEFQTWLDAHGDRGRSRMAPPEPDAPAVLTRRDGSTLRITLSRPERANAFDSTMRDQLVEALRVLATDPHLDGALIDGAGDSFCSGGDLAEFGKTSDPAAAHQIRVMRNAGWWMHQRASDIRVRVHGHCVGAGIELPAFAGTVHAEPDAVFRLPEVAMGLIPGAGGTVSIPRRIGRHRTAYMAITGQEISARQALAWGLVDRVL